MNSDSQNDQQTMNSLHTSPLKDEISFKELIMKFQELLRFLLSKWLIILIIALLVGIVGFLYASSKRTLYIADCTFVLEEDGNSGGLGQYANLASMVGIDAGGANGGIFQADNLLELYKSRTMVEKALLTEISIEGKKSLLVDRYVAFNDLRKEWAKNPDLKNFRFSNHKDRIRSRLQDSLLISISNNINKDILQVGKKDKKEGIISVKVKSADELFSKLFNDQIVQNVNDFYVQTKTKKSLQNLSVLQYQTDSVKQALNNALSGIAVSLDANPNTNPARQILKVPSQRRQVDAEANKAILTQLVTNLEVSKLSLRKETPLIQIIDSPVFPLEKSKPSRLLYLIIGSFLGGFLACTYYVIRRLFTNLIS